LTKTTMPIIFNFYPTCFDGVGCFGGLQGA
jgi:hypothetical protein